MVVRLTRSDGKTAQVLDTEQKSPQGRRVKKTAVSEEDAVHVIVTWKTNSSINKEYIFTLNIQIV